MVMVALLTSVGLLSYIGSFSYKSKASENEVSVYFNPTATIIEATDSAVFKVMMQSDASKKVSKATLKIKFDEKLKVKDAGTATGCDIFGNQTGFSVNDQDKMVTWIASAGDEPPSGIFCFGEINFEPVATGEARVELTQWTGAEVVGSDGPLTMKTGDASVATITVKPVNHDNDIHLTFISRFQGIAKAPSDDDYRRISIKVTALNELKSIRESTTGTCTYDTISADVGKWNCEVYLKVPLSEGEQRDYVLYLKGPFHIQKKICSASPEEKEPGTYKCPTQYEGIVLSSREIGYDFSKIVQLAGDLPAQDGIVNSYDTSLVRNNLGKSDKEALRLADVNLDGVVNSIDYSLIIAALSVRSDEQ